MPSASFIHPDGFIYIALELKSTLHLLREYNQLRVSSVVAIVVIMCLRKESCKAKKCKQNGNRKRAKQKQQQE